MIPVCHALLALPAGADVGKDILPARLLGFVGHKKERGQGIHIHACWGRLEGGD